ncbi:MAG: hypothetical protein NWE78_08660 [Candidatus Bathyarchaeota archaeon]|nr:hypothetical protein [Candidatus Bathyarchaeota archaeon]
MLAPFAPVILIVGGITAASWLISTILKAAPVVGGSVEAFVKILSAFGFFVGILMIVTAVGILLGQAWDSGTVYLLIVTGLALVLKPLKDVPWAALMGVVIGALCAGIVFILYPLPETVLGVSSTWVYLAIFLVPALLAYLLFKFIEDLVKLVGLILSSKPVATILGVICILQGVLMLLNMSVFTSFIL